MQVEARDASPNLVARAARAQSQRRTRPTLLALDEPDRVLEQAMGAGATEAPPVAHEHGWRPARSADPFGHECEIGKPLGASPPNRNGLETRFKWDR